MARVLTLPNHIATLKSGLPLLNPAEGVESIQ